MGEEGLGKCQHVGGAQLIGRGWPLVLRAVCTGSWGGEGNAAICVGLCVVRIYGGAQPSGALALGMWDVCMNTWLTLMAHVVGRYLCPGALNCGSEEVCVPVCEGWAVNWDSCDCMVRF